MQGLQKNIGDRIRELREKKGLSQEELAEMCHLHRTYVGLIERGRRNLSLATIEVVAGALGVSIAELFSGLDVPTSAGHGKAPSGVPPTSNLAAQIAAIRDILIGAKLTDSRRFAELVEKHVRKTAADRLVGSPRKGFE